MNHKLFILRRVQKELSKITGKNYDQIKEAIFKLATIVSG